MDGDDDSRSWAKEFGLEVTCRYPKLRTFGNWVLALAELYIREPAANYYAMFQDDFVTYRNLRAYLEQCAYPERGYWNLYTFPENQDLAPPGHTGWYPSNQYGRGAVALIFNLEAVTTILCHNHMVARPQDVNLGWRKVDGAVVSSMSKAGWKEYVHTPSLVQHTGIYSSMGNKPHRLARSFRGEEVDALSFLEESKKR